MRPDAIVIGSGPAGVHAARALMDAGKTVAILDGGNAAPAIVERDVGNFEDMRKSDPDQWKWFLGEDLSGIPVEGLEGGHGGGMTSGNRSYVTRDVDAALPVRSRDAFVVQSLATGGLAAAWGGACAIFDASTLAAMGIDDPAMEGMLGNVIRAIGVSGPGGHPDLQPPLPMDHHAVRMLQKYERRKTRFATLKATVERPLNAVLSKPMGGRSANALRDMDYYSDAGRSLWRPRWMLEELMARGCAYEQGWNVLRFEEKGDGVRVHARSIATGEGKIWDAGTLVLAAGAIGSARIAAVSAGLVDVPFPFVAKPHGYVACLDLPALGRPGPKDRLSLCQAIVADRTPDARGLPSGIAQVYGYRSLLLFRLLSAIPLPARSAMKFLAIFAPALVLADVRFPGHADDGHAMTVRTDGSVDVTGNPAEWTAHEASLRRLKKALRLAGLTPISTLRGPPGSSSHYAGTIPVAEPAQGRLTCDRDGSLHGFSRVRVADASMFRCLPPLPHTLTLMANAYRVGAAAAKAMRS